MSCTATPTTIATSRIPTNGANPISSSFPEVCHLRRCAARRLANRVVRTAPHGPFCPTPHVARRGVFAERLRRDSADGGVIAHGYGIDDHEGNLGARTQRPRRSHRGSVRPEAAHSRVPDP